MILGAYSVEQDYSHYVSRSSNIIFGVVGTATKGVVGVPTLCTSATDLIRKFGTANPEHLGLYAAMYYMNQGNKLYFVRAEGDTPAVAATVAIPGKDNEETEIPSAMVLTASTPGTYYNDLKVIISTTVVGYKIVVADGMKTLESLVYQLGGPLNSSHIKISTLVEGLTTLTVGTYLLAGGTDSSENLTAADWIKALDKLASDVYDINLFAVPGISDRDVIDKALLIAETRGDAMYLVDPPDNLEPNEVQDWHNSQGDYSDYSLLNSSYGALYYSWQNIYDANVGGHVSIPPSAIISCVMAKSARDTEIWMPAAGLQRGLVSGVAYPQYSPDNAERDALYSDENAVNCIIEDPTYGLAVFGQKTLSRAHSALDRVNVRMLLNYLKRVVVAAAKFLTFEPNDSTTWNSFEDLVEPTLRSVGERRGLYNYRIVKGDAIVTTEDIDNYRMPCKILIQPTKAAETIPIYFTITATGVDFNAIMDDDVISTI